MQRQWLTIGCARSDGERTICPSPKMSRPLGRRQIKRAYTVPSTLIGSRSDLCWSQLPSLAGAVVSGLRRPGIKLRQCKHVVVRDIASLLRCLASRARRFSATRPRTLARLRVLLLRRLKLVLVVGGRGEDSGAPSDTNSAMKRPAVLL
jgi:hypothetical protein